MPLGVPLPGATAATVAVKVTVPPNTDGLTDEPMLVVLLAWFTTCDKLEDVLAAKLTFPP